jgi:hypothetical protein
MEENKNIDPEQPAENIPEVEHSEIPPSSGKIISSEQKPLPKTEEQLSTLNLQPSDMEVHHHGHVHEKKKWKEYLFQFLMLFLAVFCGFLAEYQLEHKIEKDREKAYMYSMLEDLKSDTIQLSVNSLSRIRRVEMIDSLIFLLSSADYSTKLNDIYFYGRSLSLNIDFFPNDRTILQLKNSGALRLVHKTIVSNGIMNYDQKMRSLIFLLTQEQQQRSEYRTIASSVFNGTVFNSMIDNYETIKKPINNPALFNTGAAALNELINNAQYLKKIDMNQIKKASELNSLAAGLISLIRNEYHLK